MLHQLDYDTILGLCISQSKVCRPTTGRRCTMCVKPWWLKTKRQASSRDQACNGGLPWRSADPGLTWGQRGAGMLMTLGLAPERVSWPIVLKPAGARLTETTTGLWQHNGCQCQHLHLATHSWPQCTPSPPTQACLCPPPQPQTPPCSSRGDERENERMTKGFGVGWESWITIDWCSRTKSVLGTSCVEGSPWWVLAGTAQGVCVCVCVRTMLYIALWLFTLLTSSKCVSCSIVTISK